MDPISATEASRAEASEVEELVGTLGGNGAGVVLSSLGSSVSGNGTRSPSRKNLENYWREF